MRKIKEALVRMAGVWTETRKWDFLNDEVRGVGSKSNYDQEGPLREIIGCLGTTLGAQQPFFFVRRFAKSDS
jgi:hypothetical protein